MSRAVRIVIPTAVFGLLIVSALGDRYFRDEFYYLACTRRLDWGYVDHPPLSIAILWLVRSFAGESLLVLRATAALIAGLAVWLTGSIARRLGAEVFGETVAMMAVAVAPALLSIGSFFSMNVFDLLVWTVAARLLIEILDRPTTLRWAALGLLLGFGLENKISVLWLGGGIGAGLILTPARRLLITPGPWLAAAIAAVMFLPHVVWQWSNGFPTLEFIRNASRDKMQTNSPVGFIVDQVMAMNPFALPVWLGGLLYLLFSPRAARYRSLSLTFLVVAAILIANRTSRSGYLTPAYAALFAAGGVVIERRVRRRGARMAVLSFLAAGGLIATPLALPILSVDDYVAYSRALRIVPGTEEKKAVGRLPQFLADRQGWDQLVDHVASAWEQLTPDERTYAAVMTGNYGEAGAIELLGYARGIRAISGHNNYWLWGPGDASGDVVIVLSATRERLEPAYASVTHAGDIACGDCMPYENQLQIFICRGPKVPLRQRWPALKHYD